MTLHSEYIMNNTKTKTLAIVAILTAATLVVGLTLTATTHSAFAYQMKGAGQNDGNDNGNTLTPQTNRQYGIVSGFDNSFNQELKNLICTHPSATCSTEGSEGPATAVVVVVLAAVVVVVIAAALNMKHKDLKKIQALIDHQAARVR
jgi:hypothetical protein